jgi:UDP-glucose 4-epimerase
MSSTILVTGGAGYIGRWSAQMSDLRTIVRTAWDWHGKQPAACPTEGEEGVKPELV